MIILTLKDGTKAKLQGLNNGVLTFQHLNADETPLGQAGQNTPWAPDSFPTEAETAIKIEEALGL